ncbi:carboxymuconolactone decarboxylase family protein [Metabacillus sp. RGM 3146]|uniref:carboxymuconolactone decarboxylase family protein n=1 Tax=Metabacillus sp. RGM 3146 TaxID=3401092 RepID=UPI003B994D63
MTNSRYETGLNIMNKIFGEAAASHTRGNLKETAPDFEKMLVEFPFGDLYSRPRLDVKTREIVTISSLAALGFAAPQLKVHINGALNVGCTEEEIIEIMMQLAVYAGFPAALNGLNAAKEVFDSRKS